VPSELTGVRFAPEPEAPKRQRTKPLLSLVVPVYQEAQTIGVLLDRLVAMEIDGVDVEVVVVESNSSDGTREIVMSYAPHPRVRVILQERPRGKGNAVREGLAHVTGDIIGIQDGDLEYRLEDYPRLLAPLQAGTTELVLGCRHVPGRPLRELGHPIQSMIVNGAHWGFTLLFNLTYGVRLRDPFTMYKLFRAECIEGLVLVSDRFDFDWELLGKLIRRGYRPTEVQVTYTSRSFETGKKVRFFRDPPTWLVACFRFRFSRIPPAVPSRALPTADPCGLLGARIARPDSVMIGSPGRDDIVDSA
jgi:glycosyltransferase involved in cell wall biosynthesis